MLRSRRSCSAISKGKTNFQKKLWNYSSNLLEGIYISGLVVVMVIQDFRTTLDNTIPLLFSPANISDFDTLNSWCCPHESPAQRRERHEREISNAGELKLDCAERDKCKPVLLSRAGWKSGKTTYLPLWDRMHGGSVAMDSGWETQDFKAALNW
jgi:hypothetical protein